MMDPITPTEFQSTLSEPDVEGSWLRNVVARVVADSQHAILDRVALETEATLGVLALIRQELSSNPSSRGGSRGPDEGTQAAKVQRREEELGWREEELEWKVRHAERRELHARLREENARARDDESQQRNEAVKKREGEVAYLESIVDARAARLLELEKSAEDKVRHADELENVLQGRAGQIADREAALAEREAAVRTAEEGILQQREVAKAEEAKAHDMMNVADLMSKDADQRHQASERRRKQLEDTALEVDRKAADVEQREQSLMTRELEAARREESLLARQAEAAQREEVLIRRQREVVGREEKVMRREIEVTVRGAEVLRKESLLGVGVGAQTSQEPVQELAGKDNLTSETITDFHSDSERQPGPRGVPAIDATVEVGDGGEPGDADAGGDGNGQPMAPTLEPVGTNVVPSTAANAPSASVLPQPQLEPPQTQVGIQPPYTKKESKAINKFKMFQKSCEKLRVPNRAKMLQILEEATYGKTSSLQATEMEIRQFDENCRSQCVAARKKVINRLKREAKKRRAIQ